MSNPITDRYGSDGWRRCEACDEEVLDEETRSCESGCDLCPNCWKELTAGREVEH
jgi:CRISPR/Cas system-associated protein Cas10 (large subunit of type III CRISPR-Cas system)